MTQPPRDYEEREQDDPFSWLRFAGCLGTLVVVLFLVATAIELGAELFMGTLP